MFLIMSLFKNIFLIYIKLTSLNNWNKAKEECEHHIRYTVLLLKNYNSY